VPADVELDPDAVATVAARVAGVRAALDAVLAGMAADARLPAWAAAGPELAAEHHRARRALAGAAREIDEVVAAARRTASGAAEADRLVREVLRRMEGGGGSSGAGERP